MMEHNASEKAYPVNKNLEESFLSTTFEQRNQTYIQGLYKQLNEWRLDISEQIEDIVEEKIREIKEAYDRYVQDLNRRDASIHEQTKNNNPSDDIDDQIENLHMYCQTNTVEKRIRLTTKQLTKEQLAELIQLECSASNQVSRQGSVYKLKPEVKERTTPTSTAHVSSRTTSTPTAHASSRTTPTQEPSETRHFSVHSKQSNVDNADTLELLRDSAIQDSFTSPTKSTVTTKEESSKPVTSIYVGKNYRLTPVLISKTRSVSDDTETKVKYCVDSVAIPQENQQEQEQQPDQEQKFDDDDDKSLKLVRAYKALVEQETDYHPLASSDDDDDDHNHEDKNFNVKCVLNLENFDQTHHATTMFRECETKYNCISSSTKQNELIMHNSKLNILIILRYDNHQQCQQELFIQWPRTFSPNISDITYCENRDQYIISTLDTSDLYLFNSASSSMINLGKLPSNLPLRRVHYYQETIYCIVGNNYLLEFEFTEQNSNLKFMQYIKLFNPSNHSRDETYYLLDVTCDENCLIVVYADDQDRIHLQGIRRQSMEFYTDYIVDTFQPIEKDYVRIESTHYNGTFIYLNGSQKLLKSIDIKTCDDVRTTSVMRRQVKPTNTCFLKDGRLAILYEHPYFLSIHDLCNRDEENK